MVDFPDTRWSQLRLFRTDSSSDRAQGLQYVSSSYREPIRQFFARALRAMPHEADDLTQEIFLKLIERDTLAALRVEKSFRGFLKVVCRNHYFNWLEKQKRVREVTIEDPAVLGTTFDEAFDASLRADYLRQARVRVREELLACGKDVYWAVFEARTRDGDAPEPYKSLASRFGIKVTDVRNYLTAARRCFRDALWNLACERSELPEDELRELDLWRYLAR